MRITYAGLTIALMTLTMGCSKQAAPRKQIEGAPPATITVPMDPVKAAAHPEEHRHVALHDGTLVMIGDHAGHLEFVLDAESGTVTMYALDEEAENPVRLHSIGIDMRVVVDGKAEFDVQLQPVENVLTGETATSTSQYSVQSDELKGATAFTATIPELAFRGLELENVSVAFPGGNER